MEKLLYGAAYYEEYLPVDRLEEDIRLMKKAHMNVVRIGESTWSTLEPRDGVFDTSHLTRVIEAMKAAGIYVILGTPTYAIPPWLAKKYPEILAETMHGRERYGHRQNMDITHPAYLFHAERVIRKMMETCAHYDNVIGVQLDNETKSYGTAGANVQQGFVQYLRDKFHDDPEEMNDAFGLSYWSNSISAWEDFPDVRGTINGSLGAEFARYQRKLVAEFLLWQRKIVEPYLREDQFITHNTDFSWIGHSYGLNSEVDVLWDAEAMTVMGVDIYHPSQDQLTGMTIAFGGDLTRSVKQDNYLVLETEAQGFPEWLPYDGQLRLQAYAHLASGADMVEYWHWHSLHNGCETYWKGVLSHDFKENDTYRAAQRVGEEWERIGEKLLHLKKKNRIALLVSNTALTALQWFPIADDTGYNEVLMQLYRVLYENNLECDFIFAEEAKARIADYALVIVPALYAASEGLLTVLEQYVSLGGHLFVTYKSGFSDENNKAWHEGTPHILDRVCGISYSHFTRPHAVGLTGDPLPLSHGAQTFMECLNPEGAEVLAAYVHPTFGRYAAVTRNHYGKGAATYLGCGLSDEDLARLVRDTAALAGIDLPAAQFPVILRRGTNRSGHGLTYYMNFSAETKTTPCLSSGTDLFSGNEVPQGTDLTLPPWDLMVVEEV